MYSLLGVCLALSALLTINALVSLATASVWRVSAGFMRGWPAASRARFLFASRVFPATAALVAVVALVIPAYVAYEPWTTREVVGTKLAILAVLSAVGISLALWRGLAAWRATRRLVVDWIRNAEPVSLEGISIPTYRIRHPFPVIAVVGVVHPRLFIANRVFDSLSGDELAATVAHEAGHLVARDNLKRWLVRACRDVLVIVPCGRSLDRAWAEATERAADEHAVRTSASVSLDLASALIKIARMVPKGATPTMPAGAFLIDDTTIDGITGRVRRLAEITETGDAYVRYHGRMLDIATWSFFCGSLIAVGYAATSPPVLSTLHASIEYVVAALS